MVPEIKLRVVYQFTSADSSKQCQKLNSATDKNEGISTLQGGDSHIQGILKYALCLRLGLLETKTAAIFLPLAALLKQIDALETLQDVALRCNLAGTSKTAMLTHFSPPSQKNFAYYSKPQT